AKTGIGISIKSPLQCSGILEIFNPKGQRIAFLNSVDGNFYWDGKGSDGLLAGSGVYLLKLTDNNGFNYNGKVLILR
ncbi:MAG: T9SS type A sorting domain-containing protein, partial [Candidatus Cloacimonetes bacterium]|nr:T9SS type A sorting domain-containing protein [Candidatus Cloacimonadota bacterium]